jgi:hypothetical protein
MGTAVRFKGDGEMRFVEPWSAGEIRYGLPDDLIRHFTRPGGEAEIYDDPTPAKEVEQADTTEAAPVPRKRKG